MSLWIRLLFGTFLLVGVITGCSPSEENATDIPEENTSDPSEESADLVEEKMDFGDHAIETDDFVAYVKPNQDLYVYNNESQEEFKVHENIKKFDVFENYVLFIVEERETSELDITLESIYRTHMETEETEQMMEPIEEDNSYMTPRDFFINNNGYVAVQSETGFFYSNYWHDYTATDIDFSFEEPIVTFEDEYDYVLNDIQWQNNTIYLLVHLNEMLGDEEFHAQLRSFSIEDGEQIISEKTLPLSNEEFDELFNHTVYIGVEDSILYMSAVDDNEVEQIAYEIDIDTHEVIHKTP